MTTTCKMIYPAVVFLLLTISSSSAFDSSNKVSAVQRSHLAEDGSKINRLSIHNGLAEAEAHGVTKRKIAGFLRIHSAPPGETVAAVNENLELRCEVSGTPPPSIHWLKNGQAITEHLYDGEESTNHISEAELLPTEGVATATSILKLDCADFDTEAIYTCVAESMTDRVISSTYVHVEGISPYNGTVCRAKHEMTAAGIKAASIHMWFGTYIETQGKDALLVCRVSGNPRPQIFWLDDDGQVIRTNHKYQVLPTGDLQIRDITWEDMGGYMCVAENKHGRDESLTFLYPLRPEM